MIRPNPGFKNQLRLFERMGHRYDPHDKEYKGEMDQIIFVWSQSGSTKDQIMNLI